jgi:hypothetical protein
METKELNNRRLASMSGLNPYSQQPLKQNETNSQSEYLLRGGEEASREGALTNGESKPTSLPTPADKTFTQRIEELNTQIQKHFGDKLI